MIDDPEPTYSGSKRDHPHLVIDALGREVEAQAATRIQLPSPLSELSLTHRSSRTERLEAVKGEKTAFKRQI
jgi:hypothetical protein